MQVWLDIWSENGIAHKNITDWPHIPRVGESFIVCGSDFEVIGVTWNTDDGVVFVSLGRLVDNGVTQEEYNELLSNGWSAKGFYGPH